MWYAIVHAVMCALVIVAALAGKASSEELTPLSEMFNTDTLLLCFGIISICNRLDRIIKALHKE